jgi:hypothetical protein
MAHRNSPPTADLLVCLQGMKVRIEGQDRKGLRAVVSSAPRPPMSPSSRRRSPVRHEDKKSPRCNGETVPTLQQQRL